MTDTRPNVGFKACVCPHPWVRAKPLDAEHDRTPPQVAVGDEAMEAAGDG